MKGLTHQEREENKIKKLQRKLNSDTHIPNNSDFQIQMAKESL